MRGRPSTVFPRMLRRKMVLRFAGAAETRRAAEALPERLPNAWRPRTERAKKPVFRMDKRGSDGPARRDCLRGERIRSGRGLMGLSRCRGQPEVTRCTEGIISCASGIFW